MICRRSLHKFYDCKCEIIVIFGTSWCTFYKIPFEGFKDYLIMKLALGYGNMKNWNGR
jgi:hypothetical protein